MKRLSKDNIHRVFQILSAQNPSPQGELTHSSHYELLVAVVLSAQATDISVNKVTARLFPLANTPQAMLDLGQAQVERLIQSIGLYRSKAKHVIALSQQLIDQHQSVVPRTLQELMALPGVGRKTANVVLNMAFGLPTIAVDTHVFRVSKRLGLAQGESEWAIEQSLEKRIPAVYKMHAHHWLILHGRYVCKARKPLCADCLLTEICPSYQGETNR